MTTTPAADTRELDAFTAILRAAGVDALDQGEPIITRGALNVKTRARELAPHGEHTPHYENSISYDVGRAENEVWAEVGPREGRRQRGLGNLLEYGSENNPPHPHHEPAADEEEPRLWQFMEDMAASLVERHSVKG